MDNYLRRLQHEACVQITLPYIDWVCLLFCSVLSVCMRVCVCACVSQAHVVLYAIFFGLQPNCVSKCSIFWRCQNKFLNLVLTAPFGLFTCSPDSAYLVYPSRRNWIYKTIMALLSSDTTQSSSSSNNNNNKMPQELFNSDHVVISLSPLSLSLSPSLCLCF